MIKRNSVKTEDICREYLQETATIKSVSHIFGMHHDSIRKRLKNSGDLEVERKMKINSTKSIKKNPSKIIYIDDISFGIIPNNNHDSIHIFPIHLKDIMSDIGWSEDNEGYLQGNIGGKKMKAYYLVCGYPLNGMEIDHKDINSKNNMSNNLRIVTSSMNMLNRKTPKNNTSGYKGVAFNKKKNKWVSTISISRDNFFLGLFNIKEDAAWSRLNTKYNLFGFEFMTEDEISQYIKLLNERNGVF